MSITPVDITSPGSIPPYVWGGSAYTNITPFTYRDGLTFLEVFELFRQYLNSTLIPFINDNFSQFDDEFTADMNALIAQVNTALTNQSADVDKKIADLTKYVNDSIQAIINNSIQVQDPVMAGILADINSLTSKQLAKRGIVNATDYGTTKNLATINAAITAAEAMGLHTQVFFQRGIWDVGNGLVLNGKSIVIIGEGAGGTEANPTGTVFLASTQNGPVIDFSGWIVPQPGFGAKVKHSGFLVQGNNVATPGLGNSGLKFTTLNSTSFTDIAIRHTGGPCIDGVATPGNAIYICDFERIALYAPVAMDTNNVPYLRLNECNGNRFRGFVFRAQAAPRIISSNGAVEILGNATYSPHDNLFDAWVFEALIVPDGSTYINHKGNTDVFRDLQFFDWAKAAGALNTSFIRLDKPAITDQGGNLITGVIPGKGTGATDLDMGIDMRQSRNRVVGVKGYKGDNVHIGTTANSIDVDLGGAASGATNPAVIDAYVNSAATPNQNTVKDGIMQLATAGYIKRMFSTRFYGPTMRSLGTAVMNLNWIYAVPIFIPHGIIISELDIEVTAFAAGSTIRLGLYSNDINRDTPQNLLLDAGTVDSSALNGIKTIPGLTLQIPSAGLYWLAACAQGGTPTVRCITNGLEPFYLVSNSVNATEPNAFAYPGVSGPLLTPWSGVNQLANAPKILLKVT